MKIVKRNIVILSSDVLCATLFFLASVLLLSTTAFAQGARYDGTTQARSGFPAPAVSIAVCTQPAVTTTAPCSPLATLYTDATLTTACSGTNLGPNIPGSACSNPMLADGLGNFHFYYSPGTYTLQFYGSGITTYSQPDMTLPGSVANGSAIAPSGVNGILFVDGVKYATCAAAITAAGSTQTLLVIPRTYAGAECPSTVVATLTIVDLRSGSHTLTNNSISINQSSGGGLHTMARYIQQRVSPTGSDLALYGQSMVTGTLPNGENMDGASGEVDTYGALTTPGGNFNVVGLEGSVVPGSTGGTIPIVYGLEGNAGSLLGNTTNITTFSAVHGSAYAKSGSETVVNAYSVKGDEQTAGGTRNYALAGFGLNLLGYGSNFGGSALDAETSDHVAHRFLVVDSSSNTIVQAVGTNGLILKSSDGAGRAQVTSNGFGLTEFTPGGVANVTEMSSDPTTHTALYNSNNNGASAFTGAWNCVNVTPVTVNTSTTADQNVMACTLPAGVLNRVNRTLRVAASGIYSTPAASTAQMTVKIKLCTVSGCSSGVVITPISIQSTALGTVQITNDNWSFSALSTTQTAGASSAYEAHGDFLIDLSTLTTAAGSAFGDTNTATVGTIDSTAQLFLQCTFAFSAASGSNSATQRQLVVETIN